MGSRTQMMNLTGGNLVVHSGFNLGTSSAITLSVNPRLANTPDPAAVQVSVFDAKVYPNPTQSQFNVKLESSNTKDAITVIVYGVNGRAIEMKQNLSAGQTIQIGGLYRPGTYIFEMIQGNQHKQLKLIKIPD